MSWLPKGLKAGVFGDRGKASGGDLGEVRLPEVEATTEYPGTYCPRGKDTVPCSHTHRRLLQCAWCISVHIATVKYSFILTSEPPLPLDLFIPRFQARLWPAQVSIPLNCCFLNRKCKLLMGMNPVNTAVSSDCLAAGLHTESCGQPWRHILHPKNRPQVASGPYPQCPPTEGLSEALDSPYTLEAVTWRRSESNHRGQTCASFFYYSLLVLPT